MIFKPAIFKRGTPGLSFVSCFLLVQPLKTVLSPSFPLPEIQFIVIFETSESKCHT